MVRRVQLRRVRLVAYEFLTMPLWSMPPRMPSPTPLAPRVQLCRSHLRKIHLLLMH